MLLAFICLCVCVRARTRMCEIFQDLTHFKIELPFIIYVREFFMYSEYKFFARYITFPVLGLRFHFLDDVF